MEATARWRVCRSSWSCAEGPSTHPPRLTSGEQQAGAGRDAVFFPPPPPPASLGLAHCAAQTRCHRSVRYDQTVADLRAAVASRTGVPANLQQYFWHRRELTAADDARTLLDIDWHTGFGIRAYDLVRRPAAPHICFWGGGCNGRAAQDLLRHDGEHAPPIHCPSGHGRGCPPLRLALTADGAPRLLAACQADPRRSGRGLLGGRRAACRRTTVLEQQQGGLLFKLCNARVCRNDQVPPHSSRVTSRPRFYTSRPHTRSRCLIKGLLGPAAS